MSKSSSVLVRCAAAIVWCAWHAAAYASGGDQGSETSMLQRPYPYVVIEQDLNEVLREYARHLGLGAVVSKKVGGVVRGGARRDDTAASFLHRIGASHDLVWYVDANTLFVSTQPENGTDWLPAGHLDPDRRQALARQWSAKGEGVRVTADADSSSLVVIGPPAFRQRLGAVVAAVAHAPVARRAVSGGGAGVMVYRGASAAERVAVPH